MGEIEGYVSSIDQDLDDHGEHSTHAYVKKVYDLLKKRMEEERKRFFKLTIIWAAVQGGIIGGAFLLTQLLKAMSK